MSTSVIGQPVTRIDGKLKVTGWRAIRCRLPDRKPGVWRGRTEHDRERPDSED
jgi:hypothetical protein